jgi:hypothetical protein
MNQTLADLAKARRDRQKEAAAINGTAHETKETKDHATKSREVALTAAPVDVPNQICEEVLMHEEGKDATTTTTTPTPTTPTVAPPTPPPPPPTSLSKDLECPICFNLFYKPITLGCGHTFCQECLARALQRAQKCPLCRLPTAIDATYAKTTTVIANLVENHFPDSVAQRRQVEQEQRSTRATPNDMSEQAERRLFLFLYPTLVCPNATLPLNIFEPRYVRMIATVLNQGGRHFGMQLNPESGHGVVLEIEESRRVSERRWYVKTKCIGRYTCRNTRIEDHVGRAPLYIANTTTYYDVVTDTEAEAERARAGNEVDGEVDGELEQPGRAISDMPLGALENYVRLLSDEVLQHLTPSELSIVRNRCGDSRGPKNLSFWILSWCRFYRHNPRAPPNEDSPNGDSTNGDSTTNLALGQQRLGLLMDCTSTRDRLECIGEYFRRYRALAALHPKEFFDVNGVGTLNAQASSGFMEFLKIGGFCIVALLVFTKKDALRALINDLPNQSVLFAEGQLLAITSRLDILFERNTPPIKIGLPELDWRNNNLITNIWMYVVLGIMVFLLYTWRFPRTKHWLVLCLVVLPLLLYVSGWVPGTQIIFVLPFVYSWAYHRWW